MPGEGHFSEASAEARFSKRMGAPEPHQKFLAPKWGHREKLSLNGIDTDSRETTPKTDFIIMSISSFNSFGRMDEVLDEVDMLKKKEKILNDV